MDAYIAAEREENAWLLDWHDEISAVATLSHDWAPPRASNVAAIAPEQVVPQFGLVLTAMACHARYLEHLHQEWKTKESPDHPDFHNSANKAWAARDVLATGLSAHLRLSRQYAAWLAQALTGFEFTPPSVEARKREQRRHGPA